MKYIIILLSLIVFDKGCKESGSKLSNQEDQITFEYSATSRGFYKKIEVSKEQISVFNNRSAVDPQTNTCSNKQWNTLISNLKLIDVEKIPELEAPTKKRFSDGAPHALLTIKINYNVYTSANFDHGFPPKEIESLVKEILLISESIK